MASLMLALTQPDTETIRQAEVALKPILKDARSVPALLEVIKGRGVHVSYRTSAFKCYRLKPRYSTNRPRLYVPPPHHHHVVQCCSSRQCDCPAKAHRWSLLQVRRKNKN